MKIIITIDRFEGDKVVLKTNDNQAIIWPKNKLPKEAKEKDVLNFSIGADDSATSEREERAKDILNEILNTD
jgi:hypothetical protein